YCSGPRGQVWEPELQWWLGHRHRVCFELFLTSMHALDQPAGTGRTAVLVSPFLRTPPGDEPILCRAEAVLQAGMLRLLPVVLLFPAFPLGLSALAISGVPVAIYPHSIIRGR